VVRRQAGGEKARAGSCGTDSEGVDEVNDLMTLGDIAERWKVTRDYAQRYLVKRPEFPEPIPGSTRKTRRWLARDIDQFLTGTEAGSADRPN
jgi:hypothetical protein